MRIKVLGCSGAEFPGHNSPGFLLDGEIAFDAGSITGVLDEKAQRKIKNVFITHAHLDHIRSIPFLADNLAVGGRVLQINILSIFPVIDTIKKHLFNKVMWPDFTAIPSPEDAVLNLAEIETGKPVSVNGYIITPYAVNHTVPAVGYLVKDAQKKSFFYTGDTGPSPSTWEEMDGEKIDALIIDVSFPNCMEDAAIKTGHLTPDLLLKEFSKIRPEPERVYITHLKPRYFKTIGDELKGLGMKGVKILKSGDTIMI